MTNWRATCLVTTWCLLATAAAPGCRLDDGDKDSCVVQGDCLDGFLCRDGTCVSPSAGPDGGDDDGDGVFPDGGGGGGQYGAVEPMAPASWGAASIDGYDTLVGVTSAAGGLGCALVGDESSSPGSEAAVAYAALDPDGGDARCPDGVYAIADDPDRCGGDWLGPLPGGCGKYERWDADGDQVASRLAVGGYVSVSAVDQSTTETRCSVELSLSFAGGVNVSKSFAFTYNPGGTASSFCGH